MLTGLKDKPLMPARSRSSYRETELKGHIKSWCAGDELDAA